MRVADRDSEERGASDIDRGDVLWASDPFKSGSSAARPLIVLSNETHPFDGEQWIAVAVSTTPRSQALELTDDDWVDGTLPQRSFAYPWAVVSPRVEHVDYVVGSVAEAFVGEVVEEVRGYLEAS